MGNQSREPPNLQTSALPTKSRWERLRTALAGRGAVSYMDVANQCVTIPTELINFLVEMVLLLDAHFTPSTGYDEQRNQVEL